MYGGVVQGAVRGTLAGAITIGSAVGAEAQSNGNTAVWVALIGLIATVLAVTIPILLKRKTSDDDALIMTLVDKLAQADKEAHELAESKRRHEARQLETIEALKAELARKQAGDA